MIEKFGARCAYSASSRHKMKTMTTTVLLAALLGSTAQAQISLKQAEENLKQAQEINKLMAERNKSMKAAFEACKSVEGIPESRSNCLDQLELTYKVLKKLQSELKEWPDQFHPCKGPAIAYDIESNDYQIRSTVEYINYIQLLESDKKGARRALMNSVDASDKSIDLGKKSIVIQKYCLGAGGY